MWQKMIQDKKIKDEADITEGFEHLGKYTREFSQTPKHETNPEHPLCSLTALFLCLQAAALHITPSTSLRTSHKLPPGATRN